VKPLEQERTLIKLYFMVQFSKSIETADANHSEATFSSAKPMESGDHFKNGASSKSHTIRGIILQIIAMMFVLPFLLVSCGKSEMDDNSVIHDFRVQNTVYAKGSKLKNISHVESVKSKIGGIILNQYEYDEQGRVTKVSQPMYKEGTPVFENGTIVGLVSYSDYVYNNEGLLEKIIYYHHNVYEGLLNSETRIYSYDKNGNKIKEAIEYPRTNRTDSILYFYGNNRLVREDKYDNGIFYQGETAYTGLRDYIEYEYDHQGNLVKKTNYSGIDNTASYSSRYEYDHQANLVKESYYSEINTPFLSYSSSYSSATYTPPHSIIKHIYQNGLHVKTEIENLREIRRYYDKNDNLIYLESEELSPLSSAMSCVLKYEYY